MSGSTRRAYTYDWRHFADWCKQVGMSPLPPDPAAIGRYLTDCAKPVAGQPAGAAVATIERHLTGLVWNFAQRGEVLNRKDLPIARALAHIRSTMARPREAKVPVTGRDIALMAESLNRDLRGLRDRAMLLLGLAGGLRRGEIVGLDMAPGDTDDGSCWFEMRDKGLVLTIPGRPGRWREVSIGPGLEDQTCPITALKTWLQFAGIKHGAVFRRITLDGLRVLPDRLSGQHVSLLVKRTAMAAGLRSDLSEDERKSLFSGNSLRAGAACTNEERQTVLYLRYDSPVMVREYRRRLAESRAAGRRRSRVTSPVVV